ncbi:21543_t:CDS:2, partial [Dentiscutata erythropus]
TYYGSYIVAYAYKEFKNSESRLRFYDLIKVRKFKDISELKRRRQPKTPPFY